MKGIDRGIKTVKEDRGGQAAASEVFPQKFFPVFQHLGFPGRKIHLQNTVGYGRQLRFLLKTKNFFATEGTEFTER